MIVSPLRAPIVSPIYGGVLGDGDSSDGAVGSVSNDILLEDGYHLLLEDGSALLME